MGDVIKMSDNVEVDEVDTKLYFYHTVESNVLTKERTITGPNGTKVPTPGISHFANRCITVRPGAKDGEDDEPIWYTTALSHPYKGPRYSDDMLCFYIDRNLKVTVENNLETEDFFEGFSIVMLLTRSGKVISKFIKNEDLNSIDMYGYLFIARFDEPYTPNTFFAYKEKLSLRDVMLEKLEGLMSRKAIVSTMTHMLKLTSDKLPDVVHISEKYKIYGEKKVVSITMDFDTPRSYTAKIFGIEFNVVLSPMK